MNAFVQKSIYMARSRVASHFRRHLLPANPLIRAYALTPNIIYVKHERVPYIRVVSVPPTACLPLSAFTKRETLTVENAVSYAGLTRGKEVLPILTDRQL